MVGYGQLTAGGTRRPHLMGETGPFLEPLRAATRQALNHSEMARFIAWHLRGLILGEYRRGPRHFRAR